jgi:hypothetical protein
MRGAVKYSSRSGMGWGAELLAVFVSGFLVATILWLGLWFFRGRTAQSDAARTKEAALQAKETVLVNCVAAKNQCNELKDRVQAENQQLDAKLKEALLGWGRCIKSKNAPEPSGKPKPNAP